MQRETTSWQTADDHPDLAPGELHIWRVDLERVDPDRLCLDGAERERAARFRIEAGRRNFAGMRGALRALMSAYTGQPPASFRFAEGEHGKPFLPGSDISFNLSHSRRIGLIGFARGIAVGVDNENVDPERAADRIAARFFSPRENLGLVDYPEGTERTRAFFRCWTRKEAVIKALGEGLACPLDQFDVSLDPGRAALLAFRRDGLDPQTWSLFTFDAHPDHEAAAAVIGPCPTVRLFDFTAR